MQIKLAPEVVVALVAMGIGATSSASRLTSRNMASISFGGCFSSRILNEEFTLLNKGRRPQVLTWVNQVTIPPPKDKKNPDAERAKMPITVVSVTPAKAIIEPGASCVFLIRHLIRR